MSRSCRSVRSGRTRGLWGRLPQAILALLLAICVVPSGLRAQQATGTLTGQVVNAESGAPISSAQVYLSDLNQGTLTRDNGRYVILNVPVGTHQLNVERIGFATTSQQVSVSAGQAVVTDFQLGREVLGLDEIVVTGTAGQARKREIGNSVSQINLDQQVIEPIPDVQSLIQGRVPGVNVTLSSGVVGDGSKIRIRGNVSASLSNQPLIYIDGMRVSSEAYSNLAPANLGQQYGVQATPSPLNDINPADIDRIEIIKGAAATTLYGTEAASGVIQIFTKKGTTGAPVWTATIQQGVNVPSPHGVMKTLRGTPTNNFSGWEDGISFKSRTGGTADFLYLDPWMRNAHQQDYSMSVRGTAERVNYFVSGSFQNHDDIFVTAGMKNYAVRGNVGIDITNSVNLAWNTSYTNRKINNIQCGDGLFGVCSRSSYGGIIRLPADQLDPLVYEPLNLTQINRLITGGTLRYQPSTDWATRFTVGYDRAEDDGRMGLPFGFGTDYTSHRGGLLSVQNSLRELITLDFLTKYTVHMTQDLSSDLSVGFQKITKIQDQVQGYTEDFPGPVEATLSSGAISLSREDKSRVITGGVFGQALMNFRDRYFLTLGARLDGNSAFGQDFGWQLYPKVSGSWIISDEDFWNESLGQMKIRGAWGTAGRAPGAFDAVRTWTPIPWGTVSAYQPQNLGNADLGPEVTSEIELGFESSTFDDRLSIDFTWYRDETSDALMDVSSSPSAGGWGSQLQNVGKIENKGIELGVTGTVIRSPSWTWDLGADVSTNHSKVLDLGGAPSFSVGGQGYIAEGQPVPVIQGTKVLNRNAVADPQVIEDYNFGPNLPTLIVSPRTRIQMPHGITLTVRGEYQGGHYIQDGATQWALIEASGRYPLCFDAYTDLDAGNPNNLTALERVMCTRDNFDDQAFVYPADFFKLREVSVRMPVGWAIPQASNATLTLSGRNVFRWTNDKWLAYDPEAGGWVPGQSFTNSIWERPAPPKQFTASLNVRF